MLLRLALSRMATSPTLPRLLTARACSVSPRVANGRAAAVRCWVAPALGPATLVSLRGLSSARTVFVKHVNLRDRRGREASANVTRQPFSPAADYDSPPPPSTFEAMELHPDVAEGLRALGFKKPTDIQVRRHGWLVGRPTAHVSTAPVRPRESPSARLMIPPVPPPPLPTLRRA